MGFNSAFKGLNTAQRVSGIFLLRSDPPQPARQQPTALLSPRTDGKPEAATAVVVAPDDGNEEICCAVHKRQVINLRSCCIWLVDSVESLMMHGLANLKFKKVDL
jgi:hypothetical protein